MGWAKSCLVYAKKRSCLEFIIMNRGCKMSKIEYVEILRTNYKRMLLTKKETAIELNLSSATIARLRKNGELNSRKIGGGVYFTIEEIARFVYES